jgi:chromosome segregation ATPase
MNNDDKILKALEALQEGQKALQADVASIKDVQQQQGKDIAALKSGQEHHGKLLTGMTATLGTILEEQQAQRVDIRSLHTEVHESREELKGEIRAARDEAKRDNIDLQATVLKKTRALTGALPTLKSRQGLKTLRNTNPPVLYSHHDSLWPVSQDAAGGNPWECCREAQTGPASSA